MENLGVFPHRGFIVELDPAAVNVQLMADVQYLYFFDSFECRLIGFNCDCQVSVKVSEMFLEEFGRRLTHTCMFRDPAGSRFNVLMYNMYGEDHFTTGLASLRAHYNLHQGGWVNMFYLGASEFYLKVLDRELREVNYRDFPVVNLKVGWQDSDEEVADVESEPEDDHADFFRGKPFTIKASHLTSHTKVFVLILL